MKKFLFLATFLMIASSYTFAQNDNPRESREMTKEDKYRERSIHNFANQVSRLTKSRVPTNAKQEKLMVLIGEFMADYRSPQGEKELTEILQLIDNADREKKLHIKQAMQDLKRRIAAHKLAKKDGTRKPAFEDYSIYCDDRDDACIIAARLYQEVGYKNLAGESDCTGNCDFDKTRDPKSRGADDDQWVYTGTRKFFAERDMFGWRYLCRLEKKGEPQLPDPIDGLRNEEKREEVVRDRANPDGNLSELDRKREEEKMERDRVVVVEDGRSDEERKREDEKIERDVVPGDDGAVFSDDFNYGPDPEYAWKREVNVDRW